MSRDRCQLCRETGHCQPDVKTASDLRKRGPGAVGVLNYLWVLLVQVLDSANLG